MTFSENYFKLQSLRFGPKLTYSIQCPEELDSFQIPRLLLQPYLENAIIHGIEPCNHPCTILVRAVRKKQGLQIIIRDNGVGFDSTKTAGIGMENSKKRLENTYPNSGTLIQSQKGEGCCITLEIEGVSL